MCKLFGTSTKRIHTLMPSFIAHISHFQVCIASLQVCITSLQVLVLRSGHSLDMHEASLIV